MKIFLSYFENLVIAFRRKSLNESRGNVRGHGGLTNEVCFPPSLFQRRNKKGNVVEGPWTPQTYVPLAHVVRRLLPNVVSCGSGFRKGLNTSKRYRIDLKINRTVDMTLHVIHNQNLRKDKGIRTISKDVSLSFRSNQEPEISPSV